MAQLLRGIIPMEMGNAALAFFVSVGLAVILVEREVAVRPGIDTHLCNRLNLIRVLDGFAERQNRAGARRAGAYQWSGNVDGLTAVDALVCPVVVPIGAGGK